MKRYLYKGIAFMVFALGLAVNSMAVPAKPGLRTVKLADGSTINVYIKGDERCHYYVSEDGYLLTRGDDDYFYYSDYDKDSGMLKSTSVRATDVGRRTDSEVRFLTTRVKGVTPELVARPGQLARKAMAMRAVAADEENAQKLTDFPTLGTQKTLAILVQFKDKKFSVENPEETFKNFMMQKNFSHDNGATFSVHDYYSTCSGGKFDPQFDVYGPVTLSQNLAYYGGNDAYGNDDKPEQMVREACELLDDQINFADYDLNGDGWVDNVYIFYAGYSEAEGASANSIWPHAWDIWLGAQVRLQLDGVNIGPYGCSQELNIDNDKLVGIGVFCHEFGHVIGLPDIYSTDYNMSSFTPGEYTLMDAGEYNDNSNTPPYLTAYERWVLGWHEPEIIDRAMNATLAPLTDGDSKSFMIKTTDENEMYFLENRQQEGYDKYIPGHGMLVWHIDFDSSTWEGNSVNNISTHQGIDIVEADGKQTEDSRAGDPFPGTSNVTSFTDNTYPSMRDWQGANLNLPITEIAESDGIITFKVLGGIFELESVTLGELTDISATSMKVSWNSVPRANDYLLNLYTMDGDDRHFVKQNFSMGNVNEYVIVDLSPETVYYVTVSASDGVHISAESNVVSATTLEPDFSFYMPVVKEATDVTNNSFVANWNALDGATEYIINVYDRNNAGEIIQSIDFSNGLDDFPEGWTTNCKSLIMTEGSFGEAAPSLRMGLGGSYITSPLYNGDIRQISFWHKSAYMGSDNIASVTVTSDGTEWEVLDFLDISNVGDNYVIYGDGQNIPIKDGISQFRIYFEKPMDGESTSGFLYIDDIRVVVDGKDEPIPVFGYIDRNVGNTLSCKVTGLSAGTEYMYTIKAYNGEMNSLESVQMNVKTATSLDSVEKDAMKVFNCGDGILISSGEGDLVSVYTPAGSLVLSKRLTSDSERLYLDKGVYIVRCGSDCEKVVVW